MKKIVEAIHRADVDYGLIQNGDKICIGISGGKDSLLLIYALKKYQEYIKRKIGKQFDIIGIHLEMGFPDMNFQHVIKFMQQHDIAYVDYPTKIYDILKLHPNADGGIQCSLCSKLKKGAIIQAAKEYGCNKTAFAHHGDDAIETLLMNMIFGGRLATFTPSMHLSHSNMDFIRPFVYCFESDIRQTVAHLNLPVVKSTCPNDGHTKRQETKELLQQIYQQYPMAKHNFLLSLHNEEQLKLWVKCKKD